MVPVPRIELRFTAHQAIVLRLNYTGMVGKAGLEPAITRFQSEALATRLPPEMVMGTRVELVSQGSNPCILPLNEPTMAA